MKYDQALLQARSISEMLDIKDKLKQMKQDKKINNRLIFNLTAQIICCVSVLNITY